MPKVKCSNVFGRGDLSSLLSLTKNFPVNELGGKARQPVTIVEPFIPTIEGLIIVQQIRVEAGAIEQPEENAAPPRF